MNANEFIRNVSACSLEDLTPYVDKYVAWSEDGKHVLAVADTLPGLFREIDRLGLQQYVIDFIPDPDVSCLGGGAGF